MANKTCMNILQFVGILFIVLLTTCEILSIFVILAMEIYQLDIVVSTPFFNKKQHDLYTTSIFFLIAAIIVVIAFILQWCVFCNKSQYYRKFAYVIRNLANLLFTAAAIYHLVVMRKKNEEKIFNRVAQHWNTDSYGNEFEDKHNCLDMNDCLPEIEKAFNHVFKNGRGMKTPIALFWCSIIFYGLLSVICIIASKVLYHQ